MIYNLPELPYKYDALEPHIDEETMKLHHTKHHQTYVNGINAALENYPEYHDVEIDELMKKLDEMPEEIKTAVRNHGGGHANHSLFWTVMTPGGSEPEGLVLEKINETFGSFDKFKDEFNTAATQVFGSGWAWLVVDNKELKVVKTANQDTPLSQGMIPILGLDVWEHAYYKKYSNVRGDYIGAFWNVINWKEVNKRLEALI